jgi:very-short-patch-repair endonuclease
VLWYYDQGQRNKIKEPFCVDFAIKHDAFGTSDLQIIEIDGISHYAKARVDKLGHISYHLSEEQYTEHIQRDRILRQAGFNVFRLSNLEIKACNVESKDSLKRAYQFFKKVLSYAPYIPDFES